MIWRPAHGTKSESFSVVSASSAHRTGSSSDCWESLYLGEYGSEASRIAYGQLVANLAGGVQVDPFVNVKLGSTTTIEPEADLTTNELVLVFLRHADSHYVKNGKYGNECC